MAALRHLWAKFDVQIDGIHLSNERSRHTVYIAIYQTQ